MAPEFSAIFGDWGLLEKPMLTISQIKELIGDENIPDEQALALRDALYELADIAIEQWKMENSKSPHE